MSVNYGTTFLGGISLTFGKHLSTDNDFARLSPEEKSRRVYYEKQPGGEIVAYDMYTGRIVAQTSGLDALYGAHPDVSTRHVYHPAIIDDICDRMMDQNKTLSAILKEVPGMPSMSVIYRWRNLYPDVEKKISLAREAVAEHFYDKIVQESDHGVLGQNELASEKLRFDKLKYIAGINDPYKYGNRTIHSGDKQAPIQFVISTGIDRGDPNGTGQDFERKQRICDNGDIAPDCRPSIDTTSGSFEDEEED